MASGRMADKGDQILTNVLSKFAFIDLIEPTFEKQRKIKMSNQSVHLALKSVLRFLGDEEGLVTLEWVALAAAVIVLAIGVIVVIQTNLTTAANTIGSKIVSTVNSNS